ncbi:MAG: preprotein translocase subunit SecE [Spirochaetes bacterium]|nr:preprotein translocase subunit SecE [Spirochaetota bacterium]
MNKIKQFLKEAYAELKKVTWPSRDELKESTMVVLVTTVIISLFLGLVDKLVSEVVKMVIK